MKYKVYERFYRTYEIEADSFEDAKEKCCDEIFEGEEFFDQIAFIQDENGNEQIYS